MVTESLSPGTRLQAGSIPNHVSTLPALFEVASHLHGAVLGLLCWSSGGFLAYGHGYAAAGVWLYPCDDVSLGPPIWLSSLHVQENDTERHGDE